MRIGPYEVLGEVGRGGMGVVYRVGMAQGGEAALKLLLKADAAALARFERERRLLASLGEREGFVPLLEAGTSKEGPWLVMPFIPGGTLRARLERGPLPVTETIELGLALGRALGAAHERGIVHRDVKPENVLFAASGRPLLADLGLAKHFDRTERGGSQSVSLSQHGSIRGTAGYMAPEQLEDARTAGPPADVFALGAVLYECVAGRPAFQGDNALEVLTKLSSGTVEPIGSRTPAWLEAVIRRALARDPRARFADGHALAHALAAKRAPNRRTPLVAGVVGAVLVLAGSLHVLGRPAGPRESKPAAPPVAAPELVELAREKLGKGSLDAAIADATRAIELDAGLALAWEARGAARAVRGEAEGPFDDFSRAIALDPGFARAYAERAMSRIDRGDLDGASADATKAIELDSRLAIAWLDRGMVSLRRGDAGAAFDDLSRAIELDPVYAPAWTFRAEARLQKGDADGALADASRAIELDPRIQHAWMNRALARARNGDLDGAIADNSKAIERDPRLVSAWANRGTERASKGDLDGGIADMEHAIELDPTGASAERLRALIAETKKRGR